MHKCINLIRRGCVRSFKDLPQPPTFHSFSNVQKINFDDNDLENLSEPFLGSFKWKFGILEPFFGVCAHRIIIPIAWRNYHKIALRNPWLLSWEFRDWSKELCVLLYRNSSSRMCKSDPAVIYWREIYYVLEVKFKITLSK